ncbi:MAG: FMN-dependent NADH-azoreductase [Prochlorococcaceae cyanobacterium]
MKTLLHIDSSPRGENSRSRLLASTFVAAWKEAHPDNNVIYRDLRNTPLPHITEEWIAADFTPRDALSAKAGQLLELSDMLVDEFLAAERCVYSVPMYNFGIPSSFKAYIDNLVRFGRTFKSEHGSYQGLAKGKKVLFITARGVEYGSGSPYQGWDAQEPGLKYAFQFVGVSDIRFIHACGLDLGEDSQRISLEKAKGEIIRLSSSW